MLKPRLKPCKECKDDKLKYTIKGLCQYHYRIERVKIYKAKNNGFVKKKKSTGELNLFNKIFDIGPKVCFVTGQSLQSKCYYTKNNTFHCLFHHVLPKSLYPEFRLYEKNIIMVLPNVHHLLETKAISDLIKTDLNYQKVIDLKTFLKSQYYERSNQGTI